MPREGDTGTAEGRPVVYQGGQWVFSGPPGGASGQRRLSASDADFLRDQRDGALAAAGAARVANDFMSINRTVPTGGIIRAIPGMTEIEGTWNADVSTMDALNNRMAPGLRQPGSGAMSDRDLALFRRSIPNPNFPGPTNQRLARTITDNATRYSQYVAFMEDWAERNGNLLGAQAAWDSGQGAPRRAAAPARQPAQEQRPRARIISVE